MATQGQRPGGLTVLAVENLIFGALMLLQVLSLMAMLGIDELRRDMERTGLTEGAIYGLIVLNLVESGLLIASGTGYLGQRRFRGKILGNVYCGLGLAGAAVAAVIAKQFNLFTVVSVVYPVMCLTLLNTTFREDFINP